MLSEYFPPLTLLLISMFYSHEAPDAFLESGVRPIPPDEHPILGLTVCLTLQ